MVYVINILIAAAAVLWKRGKILKDNPVIHEQWIRAMCIGQSETDRIIAHCKKQKDVLFYLLLGGCLLSCTAAVWEGGVRRTVTQLSRPDYGNGSRTYELLVEGLEEKVAELEVEVSEKKLSAAAGRRWLEGKFEEISPEFAGENPSLQEVRYNLKLPLSYEGIRIRWFSPDPQRISDRGEIMTTDLPEKGTEIRMEATLSYGGIELKKEVPVRIFPPDQSGSQEQIAGLQNLVESVEQEQQEEYEGKTLKFYRKKDNPALQISLLSVLLAVVFYIWMKRQPEQKLRERSRQLQIDYAEVITRLTVSIRSGMSIRKAWERMAQEYLVRKQNGGKIRFVYEEIVLSCYRMESGIPEGAAYAEFGRQCGPHCYLRLGNLLEQNVRKGGTELLSLLEQEAGEAFEEQKNMARKIGEEAQTKLLLPMTMMLGVVLIILIVPVFSGFSI